MCYFCSRTSIENIKDMFLFVQKLFNVVLLMSWSPNNHIQTNRHLRIRFVNFRIQCNYSIRCDSTVFMLCNSLRCVRNAFWMYRGTVWSRWFPPRLSDWSPVPDKLQQVSHEPKVWRCILMSRCVALCILNHHTAGRGWTK